MTFFTTNVVNYIGDNEWLWYFVTGNGGSEPVYSVKSVSRTGKDTLQKPDLPLLPSTARLRRLWNSVTNPPVQFRSTAEWNRRQTVK